MNIMEMIREALSTSVMSMLQIALIVTPLLIVMEFLKAKGWVDKITELVKPATKSLYLPKESAFPVVVGWTIGLQYGAGVMMQVGREGVMNTKDLTITCVFVGIAHSLIEETVIFAGIGGNALILLAARFLAGVVFTYIFVLQLKLTNKFSKTAELNSTSSG